MSLPILNVPKFELELPLSKKRVTYRPFLVKEEKVLLMALESQDQKQIVRAMHDIIESCTFNTVKAKDLPVAELEYLFLRIRAKAVGEKSTIGLKCQSCDHSVEVDLNLEEIALETDSLPDNKIMLTDTIGVIMKYPTSDLVMKSVDAKKSDVENTYAVIESSLDKIFDSENVYDVSTQTKQEIQAFIESLNKTQFEKIKEFFANLPKLTKPVDYKCDKCGSENHLDLEGLESFFA